MEDKVHKPVTYENYTEKAIHKPRGRTAGKASTLPKYFLYRYDFLDKQWEIIAPFPTIIEISRFMGLSYIQTFNLYMKKSKILTNYFKIELIKEKTQKIMNEINNYL